MVQVSFGLDVGGQEKLLVEFARHCDRELFAQTFVSLGSRGALAGSLEACGSRVIALDQPSGLKPSLIVRLARLFRRERALVVHTHDPRSLIYASLAAGLSRIPQLVHTRHGRDVNANRFHRFALRQFARLVDDLVCVSEDVARMSRAEGVTGRRLHTIHNGIDMTRFPFVGPNSAGPAVTVARLSPEKDVANLVQATALAVRQAPDFRVEVAGNGPCRADLERLTSELGVGEHVQFLGEIADVPAFLARARLFVLASRSEGIPLTVLEAMACGLPVIATQVGGLAEVVEAGKTGLLVPSAAPEALAGAMLTVWRDSDQAAAMGSAGRQRAEGHFDIRRMIDEYEAVYLRGKGRRRWLDVSNRVRGRTCSVAELPALE